MHNKLANISRIFVLPALFVCCSLAQENADVKAFDELQWQWWRAPAEAKAQKFRGVIAALDSICIHSLQDQTDFSAKKARIDSFYNYCRKTPLLRIARIDQETSVIIYNISTGVDTYIPLINVFSTSKNAAKKVATLCLENTPFPPDTYMHISVPFQYICILNDSHENKNYILLGGTARIGNYLSLIELSRNRSELKFLEARHFNMWNAVIENRVRLAADGIIVCYPMESNVITEGWGEAMLLAEDLINVRNGALKTVARKVLNPWYQTVLNAIRFQRAGDREGFNKLCKAEKAWQLLSGKTDMMTAMRQEKIDNTKAIVILTLMGGPTELVFHVSREDEKWIIVDVERLETA